MIGEKIRSGAETIKGGIKKVGKRNLFICLSVLIIAAAICVNWAIFAGNAGGADGTVLDPGAQNTSADQTPVSTDTTDVTDESVASYFASVQINRQQARDEALEVLSLVIESDSAIESAKADAIADVSRIADEIASEANIETLVKAKGFEDCVAVINNGSATIVVKTESALMQNEVAQIMEIVYEQANISPENIKITEKY